MKLNKLKDFYQRKKVLITGHTGFKGAWLSIWLKELGAEVVGYSLDPKTENDLFVLGNLSQKMVNIMADIRDIKKLNEIFDNHKPEIVFHLAAQPLVRDSYNFPQMTFETNVMGTVNVLESIRRFVGVRSAVIITTDKCYKNKEWIHGYRENDELGGSDPYSASKSCAEMVINSYVHSFFQHSKTNIASARAGNVIGGGDWAKDRIIPDSIRALLAEQTILVRNPGAIRPWQHVLEPLYGYLLLGAKLYNEAKFTGPWNFGPDIGGVITVRDIVDNLITQWGSGSWESIQQESEKKQETNLLNLDNSKAKLLLGWKPKLKIDETLHLIVEWYQNYQQEDVYQLCKKQIEEFMKID